MTCPSNASIDAFVSGSLDGSALPAIEKHMDGCMACREAVSLLAKMRAEAIESQDSLSAVDEAARPVPERYQVVRLLGRGGMGSVFLVQDQVLNRPVALKLIRPERYGSDDKIKAKERFFHEAQNMAKVSNRNVVTIHDFGYHQGQPFIAMEYVQGKSLGGWLVDAQPDLDAIVAVMTQAGEGLAAAHEAGLIHRDFKPDNVLVSEEGQVRITDFGLSSVTASSSAPNASATDSGPLSLTQTGMVLGTPSYMAPEQHESSAANERSDQYSFCVSFYEAVSGTRPFAGSSSKSIAANKQANKLRPLPTSIPKALRSLIVRGLRADPDQRHPSMRSLLAELASVSSSGAGRLRKVLGLALLLGSVLAAGLLVAHQIQKGEEQVKPPIVVPPPRLEVLAAVPARPRQTAAVIPDAAPPASKPASQPKPKPKPAPKSKPVAENLSPRPKAMQASTRIELLVGGVSHPERFSSCRYCDFSDGGTHYQLRYQQDKLIWLYLLPKDAKVGKHLISQDFAKGHRVSVSVLESDVPFAVGAYAPTLSKKSFVILREVDLSPGGVIKGTLNVQLTYNKIQMHFVSRFRAIFPG